MSAQPDLAGRPAIEVARLVQLLGIGAPRPGLDRHRPPGAVGRRVPGRTGVGGERTAAGVRAAAGPRRGHPGLLLRLVTLEGVILGFVGGASGVTVSRLLLLAVALAGRQSGMRLAIPPPGVLELSAIGSAMALGLLERYRRSGRASWTPDGELA